MSLGCHVPTLILSTAKKDSRSIALYEFHMCFKFQGISYVFNRKHISYIRIRYLEPQIMIQYCSGLGEKKHETW